MGTILTWLGLLFAAPRIVIAVLYIFFRYWLAPINIWYWLVLGFIFMPISTLWYCAVYNWFGGAWTWWQALILILAILGDLSSTTSQFGNLLKKD
jgi:hypothetical protein